MSLLTSLLRFTTQTHHNSTQAGGGGRDSGEVELLGCLSLSRSSCSSDMDPQCRWHWREHGHQICDLCDELHCFVPPQRREVLVHCSLQPTNWQQRYYVWKKSDPRRSLWVCLSMYIYVRLLFQIKQLFHALHFQNYLPDPPNNTSVSYPGPVKEGSSVTLTCNTNANPAVDSYTWYRVDGDQVTAVGSKNRLSTTVMEDDSQFYCKVTNKYGAQNSSVIQIDVLCKSHWHRMADDK